MTIAVKKTDSGIRIREWLGEWEVLKKSSREGTSGEITLSWTSE